MQLNTPSLLWFLAGVVLLLLELSMPGFVLFFFAVGAWLATAAASWWYPLGLNSQILVFIVASLVSLVALRRLVKKAFSGARGGGRDDSALAEPGVKVVVVADIVPPAEGRIEYFRLNLAGRSQERIEAGELAEIIEQEGLLMLVKRVDNAEL